MSDVRFEEELQNTPGGPWPVSFAAAVAPKRIMLDGVDSAAVIGALKARRTYLGIQATIGAGYGDGPNSAWPAAAWPAVTAATAPQPPVVITVTGQPGRNVADVETGDLTVPQGLAWVRSEHAAGRRPVLYVNRGNKPAVLAGWPAGVPIGLWVATLDGTFLDLDGRTDLRQEPGVVAVQYLGAAQSGGPWDVSLAVDPTWLPPKPPTPPTWQAQALTMSAGTAAQLGRVAADLATAQAELARLASLLKAHQ